MSQVVSAGVFSKHKAYESHLASDLQLELRDFLPGSWHQI